MRKVYKDLDKLPTGRTSGKITEGTLVLEGGAWRGIYTQGALDALMEADITFRTTIGVSAGAMAGVVYVAGQIGLTGRINLSHRSDPKYVGWGAMLKDHGMTGFTELFGDITKWEYPLDTKRFFSPETRFYAVATNMNTGEPWFFEKGRCRILRAVQASASVPYLSRPLVFDGDPYLDGGCSVHIPYQWAEEHFPGKIMVIRTRDASYRAKPKKLKPIDHLIYGKYPKFLEAMVRSDEEYNQTLDQLDADGAAGKAFVLTPEEPINISHFESDLDVLGNLYWLGYNEMKKKIPELREYLEK